MSDKVLLRVNNPYPVPHEISLFLHRGQFVRVGRGGENELVIKNRYISRRHALISWDTDEIVVSDLKSLNGTRLNGQLIKSDAPIRAGDTIMMSSVAISIEAVDEHGRAKDPSSAAPDREQLRQTSEYILEQRRRATLKESLSFAFEPRRRLDLPLIGRLAAVLASAAALLASAPV